LIGATVVVEAVRERAERGEERVAVGVGCDQAAEDHHSLLVARAGPELANGSQREGAAWHAERDRGGGPERVWRDRRRSQADRPVRPDRERKRSQPCGGIDPFGAAGGRGPAAVAQSFGRAESLIAVLEHDRGKLRADAVPDLRQRGGMPRWVVGRDRAHRAALWFAESGVRFSKRSGEDVLHVSPHAVDRAEIEPNSRGDDQQVNEPIDKRQRILVCDGGVEDRGHLGLQRDQRLGCARGRGGDPQVMSAAAVELPDAHPTVGLAQVVSSSGTCWARSPAWRWVPPQAAQTLASIV
jgi:hypothetical protein